MRVDVFYASASPRVKAWIDLLGVLLLLLPLCAAIVWFSWPYVARSWAILERSRETSGLPFSVGNGRKWPTNWNVTPNATTAAATWTNRTTL